MFSIIFPSLACAYTRDRAAELWTDLVFLPAGSPHLTRIEPLWKSLKWEVSPIAVSSIEAFCSVVREVLDRLTENVSFAADRIERFSNIQKLS